jgi:hypothetical protein
MPLYDELAAEYGRALGAGVSAFAKGIRTMEITDCDIQ